MPKREDYYLAQIAAEVRRTIARKPQSVKPEDFLLKFKFPVNGQTMQEPTEEEKARRLATSKARWFAIAGFKGGAKK